jgi:2-polyprenyl-6-methoxyphenol hydroxylase-like FAD-dependent oxidoreductase
MDSRTTESRKDAIVIGGSLAGLLSAFVLAKHFALVTIIERDMVQRQPESRKGQPHTKHIHGLLPSGLNVLCNYFPDLLEDIVQHGATVVDFADSMNWYAYGGFKKNFTLGISGVSISRPLLEHLVRERVLTLPNIRLLDNSKVLGLTTSSTREKVTGVTVEDRKSGSLSAYTGNLVVDCSGRGSQTPHWLKEIGYEAPKTTEVKVNVCYTTRTYERDPGDPRGKTWILYTPEAPADKRMGAVFPIEGNRWIVTAVGWHHEHAPMEENGYLEFVKKLGNPNIYDIVSKCKPLSEFVQQKFPASTWRHYEKLTNKFPLGLLVVGDAVSSFNPIYGQGMSSAALQAVELEKLLTENVPDDRLASTYFKRIAKIVDAIWQLATGEDFRFPETVGKRPFGIDVINKYVARVHRATVRDEVVCAAFLHVMALLKPPTALLHPDIIWRVMKAS